MSEWQDISTAPKDGSEILLFVRRKHMVCIGYYARSAQSNEEGWVISDFWGPPQLSVWPPTHWMPLPAPPHSS